MELFEHEAFIPFPLGLTYQWHTQTDALSRLLPPWVNVSLLRKASNFTEGSKVTLRIKKGPFKVMWRSRHTRIIPNQVFEDVQVEGPFKQWRHEHHFTPDKSNPDACFLKDAVEYGKLKGTLGLFVSNATIEREIKDMFLFRNAALCNELTQYQKYQHHPKKRILICGASGLIGKNLSAFLKTQGHDVYTLTRRKSRSPKKIFWEHRLEKLNLDAIEGFDVVIHLGGESIGKKWTPAYKKKLAESRIKSTNFLVSSLNKLKQPPKLFICASAVGYYGSQCYKNCPEDTHSGSDFLGDLCFKWEQEAKKYTSGRAVQIRLGVVLSPKGGMLKKMRTPFSLGLGGPMGSGKQKLSWIALDDVLYHVQNVIYDEELTGPINFCAPEITTNEVFSKELGAILGKATPFRMPEFVVKSLFGEMGESLILGSSHAEPNKLLERGHSFAFPVLKQCLRHQFGKYGSK